MIKVDTDVIAIRRTERHVAYGSSGPLGHPIGLIAGPRPIMFRRTQRIFTDCKFIGDIPQRDISHRSIWVECWQCFECNRYFFATDIDGLAHECTGE